MALAAAVLIELSIGGYLFRVSTYQQYLTHQWHADVLRIDDFEYSINTAYGGYCRPQYGSIVLKPDMFHEYIWPPPVSIDVTVKYALASGSEETAIELFAGSGHLNKVGIDGVGYELYSKNYYRSAFSGTALLENEAFEATSMSLNGLFSWACSGNKLNKALDTTKARSPSPLLNYTFNGPRLVINIMDQVGAYFTHLFYFDENTDSFVLVDMFADNGTVDLRTSPYSGNSTWAAYPKYFCERPIGLATADRTDDTTYLQKINWSGNTIKLSQKFGSTVNLYGYGDELTLEAFGQVENTAAMDKIMEIANRINAEITFPMEYLANGLVKPGSKILWTDSDLEYETAVSINARSIRYDLFNEMVTVRGDGTMT